MQRMDSKLAGRMTTSTLIPLLIMMGIASQARAASKELTKPQPATRTAASRQPSAENVELIAEELGKLFESVTDLRKGKAKRTVFGKAHGCLAGIFSMSPKAPKDLRIGAFAGTTYPAVIRFANDGGPSGPDSTPGARGMAVKLIGVPGKKILEGEEDALTQDFVMQNHPVFFSNTAADFLAFNNAAFSRDPEQSRLFNEAHPETQPILDAIDANKLLNPLEGKYWTPTPYRLGAGAMKYMAKPERCPGVERMKPKFAHETQSADFLRDNLRKHIGMQDACMGFWVQVQKNPQTGPETMPLDRASVKWSEEESRFVRMATIRIPKGQDIDSELARKRCEDLTFTGWHALKEHEPLGSINLARKFVYRRISAARHKANGVPVAEPMQGWRLPE